MPCRLFSHQVTEVYEEYGFPSMHTALALLNRSKGETHRGGTYALDMQFKRGSFGCILLKQTRFRNQVQQCWGVHCL